MYAVHIIYTLNLAQSHADQLLPGNNLLIANSPMIIVLSPGLTGLTYYPKYRITVLLPLKLPD